MSAEAKRAIIQGTGEDWIDAGRGMRVQYKGIFPAISEASREIRTGQAQEAGFSEQDFRDAICSELFGLLDCGSNLHIDVRKLSGFGSASTDMPLDSDGNFDETGFGFDPGGANDVVAVRVFYEWTLLNPILSAPLVNMNGSKHLIQANAVFRNEPFGD